jgi:hypothetical protein
MDLEEADFFIRGLPNFHKDQMRRWNSAWPSELFTLNSCWKDTLSDINKYVKQMYCVKPSPVSSNISLVKQKSRVASLRPKGK